MSAPPRPGRATASGLRRLWGERPWMYSRPLWGLLIALDHLPWPWGEDILARLFAMVALVRGSRRRPALAFARRQPGRRVWATALAVAAFRGRWVARSSLLGVRCPDELRARIVVKGEEHLAPAPGGTILVGFHFGPPTVDVVFRLLGHRVAWLGSPRRSRAWGRQTWQPLVDRQDNLTPAGDSWFWPGFLYRARRILLEGGTIYVLGDSWAGRELFRMPLPGGELSVRAGWFTLQRLTGARVVPVLAHLEGRVQVITVHGPLPLPEGNADPLPRWREILTALLTDYVSRYPEQCPVLVFPPTLRPRSSALPPKGTGPRPRS